MLYASEQHDLIHGFLARGKDDGAEAVLLVVCLNGNNEQKERSVSFISALLV